MLRKSKPPRDPNAPKRNMSAYLLYQNAMREQFKNQNPGMTFGQLAKYTSAMYAEMQPEEKQAWSARAVADKERYLHELSTYVPPFGFCAKGDVIMTQPSEAFKKGKRSKSDRDSNAPKRSVPAYLLYQNANRAQFKAENPELSFGDLAKYTSQMYKTITPEEKSMWESKALEDKLRYQMELTSYVPPPGYDAKGNLLESAMSEKKRRRKMPKDPLAPKRARGSFVFFTYDIRPIIIRESSDIKFIEVGRIMGERWRALNPEEKQKYEILAAEDKIRFRQEMEEYTRAAESATEVQSNSNQEQMQQQEQMYQQQMYQQEYQQDLQREYQQQQEHMYVPQIPSHDKSIQYSMN
mmetsp:Transcript_40220/g.78617  ORF Transcript_40220/g.78617 Transcript_40220/m.78617 type:complete len:352 (-) Transcript_40220:71-1126(-)